MDRNAVSSCCLAFSWSSLSARRAWIEIWASAAAFASASAAVALRKESVDRNLEAVVVWVAVVVALRKESVDRNPQTHIFLCNLLVALRKESVDRNKALILADGLLRGSLSARRAWIEIVVEYKRAKEKAVALRKESVDRNLTSQINYNDKDLSLSARRAWIEILEARRLWR